MKPLVHPRLAFPERTCYWCHLKTPEIGNCKNCGATKTGGYHKGKEVIQKSGEPKQLASKFVM